MRLLLAAAVYAALTICGYAQNGAPQELNEIETIKIYPGETKVFTFSQAVAEVRSTGDNVKIIPESDRTFAFVGLSPGSSILTALNSERQLVHRSRLIVAGNVVRIYGTSTVDEKKADYLGYICTDMGCGRADSEVERQQSGSVSRTRRNSRGDIITTTTSRD